MDCKLSLRKLLLLDAGLIDPAERKNLLEAVERNPACKKIWLRISQHAANPEVVGMSLGRRSREQARLAPELIGSYLDGALDSQSQRQVERLAVQDPALLAELILHFRAQAAQPESGLAESGLVPWAVTERLFGLSKSLKQAPPIQNHVQPADQSKLPSRGNSAVGTDARPSPRPVQIQMARAVAPSQVRQAASDGSRNWGVIVAFLTAAAAAMIGLWLGYLRWTDATPNSRLAELERKAQSQPALQSGSATSAGKAERAEGPSLNGLASGKSKTDGESGGERWSLISLDEDGPTDSPGLQIDAAASVFHQYQGSIPDLKWLSLEGVVALREPGKDLWFGPRSTAKTANGLEWRTLPDSWATARLGGRGEIVLDSDSSVVVNVTETENLISLDFAGGRVGLKKLPADLAVRIRHDRLTWDLQVLQQGTNLAVDWLNGEPRLAVQAGRVRAGESIVRENQQLVGVSASSAAPTVRSGLPQLGPLSDRLAWLEKPAQRAVVSEAAQSELLASANVIAEMNRLETGKSERIFAQHLPAILAPEAQLLGALEGADAKSRSEALKWLLSLSPRSPKTRQIWRSISEKSGVPDLTREYFRLIQLFRTSGQVAESDAMFLTSGLKHQRLFVREMSQGLLEIRFGNTVQFDAADANEQQRAKRADAWTREIADSYRLPAVPKR